MFQMCFILKENYSLSVSTNIIKFAYLSTNIINFDAVNFSEHRSEEVVSFFWCSVYIAVH